MGLLGVWAERQSIRQRCSSPSPVWSTVASAVLAAAMAAIIGVVARINRARRKPFVLDVEKMEAEEDATDVEETWAERSAGFSGINRLRLYIWLTFEEPGFNFEARIVSATVLLTIIISVGGLLVASWPVGGCEYTGPEYELKRTCASSHGKRLGDLPAMEITETICVMIFSVEYLTRMLCCSVHMKFWKFFINLMNSIDLLAILPWYLNRIMEAVGSTGDARFVGVLRIVRLMRVVRIWPSLHHVPKGLSERATSPSLWVRADGWWRVSA